MTREQNKVEKKSFKLKFKEFLLMFIIQLFLYGLLCVNYRAVAVINYTQIAVTDFLIASLNFFVIRKIATSNETLHQWSGYALGGVVGSIIGTWVSQFFLGQ